MIRKIIPAIFMVFMSGIQLHAQDSQNTSTGDYVTAPDQVGDEVNCPNNHRLNQLCLVMKNKLEEKDQSSPHLHLYQTIIMNAACANPDIESSASVQRKIQTFWQYYSGELTCNDPTFTVPRGNILKYGVKVGFDDFMHDVVEWKIDLNRIDPSDNKTVLDFTRDEQRRLKGTVLEAKMGNYYKLLRNAGAKHRSELE